MQDNYKIFNILSGKRKAQYLPIVDTIIMEVISELKRVQETASVLFPVGDIPSNTK